MFLLHLFIYVCLVREGKERRREGEKEDRQMPRAILSVVGCACNSNTLEGRARKSEDQGHKRKEKRRGRGRERRKGERRGGEQRGMIPTG